MKKHFFKIFCIFLVLLGTMPAFALEITGAAPEFEGGAFSGVLNGALQTAFNQALTELNNEVKGIDSKPEKFIQAWGNSSVFASHGATQRAYGGYKLFAATLGTMMGFQLPSNPFTIVDQLGSIADTLNNDQDLKIGLNPQIITGRFGLNTSFLVKNLYLGIQFGYMQLPKLIEGFSFSSISIGAAANYQLLSPKKLAAGLVLWRGLNLGAGFIYTGTKADYAVALDSITQSAGSIDGHDVNLTIDPKLNLDMDIKTFTIPLEAVTAVRLLWFLNIPLGLGADLSFGKSDMKISAAGDITVDGANPTIVGTQKKTGNINLSAGGDMAPNIFNLKLMTGIGINLGPAVIDIPLTWYFLDNGFNVGITIGVVW